MTYSGTAPPSRNPTNDGSMVGMFNVVLKKFLQRTDDMLPAKIIAYDRTANMASVQPLISIVTTLNTTVVRAQIAQVPVIQLGAGGSMSNFALNAGDLGFIKANDRDISLFKQFWRMVTPATQRRHSFEDCVFIPAQLTDFTIEAEDDGNYVVGRADSTVRISFWTDNVKVTAPQMTIGDTEGYTPHANAILDLQSTTKAFQVPRMTGAQRDAIPSPQGGLMVYVTDNDPSPHLSVWTDGTGWS